MENRENIVIVSIDTSQASDFFLRSSSLEQIFKGEGPYGKMFFSGIWTVQQFNMSKLPKNWVSVQLNWKFRTS